MFDGKVVLVTGAGSGMGRESALRFAAGGARVIAADLRAEAAQEVAAEIGDATTPLEMDVSSRDSVFAGVASVLEGHGGIDVVVNNAGMVSLGSAAELDEAEWDRVIDVNLKGVYLVSKAAWPSLAQRGGNIVNLASINAYMGMEGNIAYCTSKAGVVMLTKCMALDGARDGIRVNCVCPGWIETPLTDGYFETLPDPEAARAEVAKSTPMGRMGRPSDIAEAIAYLASDGSEWVTGTALLADGGILSGVWNGG